MKWARLIQAADGHAVRRSFEIAAVRVAFAAGKPAPAFQWVHPFGEDGHTVPRCLPMPDGSVTSRVDVIDRKCRVGGLQFLQADHIPPFAL